MCKTYIYKRIAENGCPSFNAQLVKKVNMLAEAGIVEIDQGAHKNSRTLVSLTRTGQKLADMFGYILDNIIPELDEER